MEQIRAKLDQFVSNNTLRQLTSLNNQSYLSGNFTKVMAFTNLYDCVIGDYCFIGPFTEIQKDVLIHHNVRIQSHSFICSGVEIKSGCFIGHGVMFINDTFSIKDRPSFEQHDWKETIIGENVYIGSNSTILPVNICANVTIGAGSVVTKDITKPGVYVGNPAKFLRYKK